MKLQKTRTFSDRILLFIKGVAMGGANKVPGVSGGIVAFVTGFYEELIYSFKRINGKALKLLLNGRFKAFFQYTNAKFLAILFSGSLFSYFSVSLLLDFLLKRYELFVWSFFFGLIIGSIYYIAKGCGKMGKNSVIAIIIGVTLGILISLLPPAKENANLGFVFLCGIIGVSGMTIPGLSGSFILILLGNYVLLLIDAVNMMSKTFLDIISGNFNFIHNVERMKYLKIIGAFTAGSAFGLVITSHILGYVIKRWGNIVTATILGFIIGSLGNVWPWKSKVYTLIDSTFVRDSKGNKILENYQRFLPNFSKFENVIALGFILTGIAILILIEYYSRENKSTL
ncbi:MAG: DUF368 domain-containing protein [Flavobacteriaceae bacterium]